MATPNVAAPAEDDDPNEVTSTETPCEALDETDASNGVDTKVNGEEETNDNGDDVAETASASEAREDDNDAGASSEAKSDPVAEPNNIDVKSTVESSTDASPVEEPSTSLTSETSNKDEPLVTVAPDGEKITKATKNDDSEDDITPIDPSLFPPTKEGLAEFMAAVNGDKDAQPKPPSTFQANAVVIKAGDKREIAIPIFTPGKVEWETTVQESDVGLSILLKEQGSNNNTINICTDYVVENVAALSGEFHITTVPSTICLVFDNSYSWITPKTVSYKIQVSPPIDKTVKVRTVKTLEVVRATLAKAEQHVKSLQESKERAREALQKQSKELNELEQSAAETADLYTEISKRGEQAEQDTKAADRAVSAMNAKIMEEDRQLAELEKRIQELQLERQVRMEERDALVQEMESKCAEAAKTKTEAEQHKEQGQVYLELVKQHERDLMEKRSQVAETAKERDEVAAQEKINVPKLHHYRRQAEALELKLKSQQ